ncbi:MAG: threonine ammonia-lyase [Pyrinomonadaceae bacterium]
MTTPATSQSRLSLENIAEAAQVIDPVFTHTPQFVAESLSKRLGFRLICKVETCNPIRSFKGRGADYFLNRQNGNSSSLVCASAGNFGQGLAFAARKRGIRLTVFASEKANPLKLARMRELGAEVRLRGEDFDAAKVAAHAFALQENKRFVEDGQEAAISEGAGTIALELCQLPESLDVLLVPLGNGAMINGVGCWMKAHSPSTKIIGVCAEGAPAMERSWRSQSVITTESVNTIADGIGVRVPVAQALEDMLGLVDEVLLVDDASIIQAMNLLMVELGLMVEPAGAAGVAAALSYRERWAGALVASPLCGGNVTVEQMRHWLSFADHW